MLEIVETYLQALSAAKSEADVSRVLRDAAADFGFRSAYLIEYAGKLSAVQRVLDTDPDRKDWWNGYFASDLRPSPREVAASLNANAIHRYDNSRFGPGSERLVMRLSAAGLTSGEIAEQLGMAARTVNQHVDNVADKLGTRNRAHTVAEIVRRGLL